MIARIFRAWTLPLHADEFERLMRHEIFPRLRERGLTGVHGIELLRREESSEVEFVTIMWFDSLDAVRAFSGDDYEKAMVPPRVRALLRGCDARALHYVASQRRSSRIHERAAG